MIANLHKMVSELQGSQIHYFLNDKCLNDLIGQQLHFHYQGDIHCRACGRKTSKSYQQGFCYPCFKKLACCDRCMISPEKCHYEAGTCREPQWAKQHCFQPHTVYLANTSGLKVGISRDIPTRWIDQGATQALPIVTVSNRQQSGLVECIFKRLVADKTQWRKMLQGNAEPLDLIQSRDDLFAQVETELAELQQKYPDEIHLLADKKMVTLDFPVQHYPKKVVSLNFDKTPEITGQLWGIKGQYLILDTGVLNIRKFAGYSVELQVSS